MIQKGLLCPEYLHERFKKSSLKAEAAVKQANLSCMTMGTDVSSRVGGEIVVDGQ